MKSFFGVASFLVLLLNNVFVTLGANVTNTECPDEFTAILGGCYYFSSNQLSWYKAFKSCIEMNSHLVAIETTEENEAIKDYIRSLALNRNYWIGATDESQEGYYVWIATLKGADFTDWCSGDPNNYGSENCAYLVSNCDYRWQDRSCDYGYVHYICEI